MNEKILKAYASAPKTWIWKMLAAFGIACLLAWSGSAVRVSNPTGIGLEVAGNILSGIFHPSAKLLFTLGTDGVPYLLLETFCIAFLGTIVGAVISLPLSFLSGLWLPLSVMPAFLREIAPLWPAYHLGQLAYAAVGQPSTGSMLTHVAALALVTVAFLLPARRRLARG